MTRNRPTAMLPSLAAQCRDLTGWWRNTVCLLLGVSLTLSLPPLYFLPFLFVAFTGLIWLATGADNTRRAFFDGWWFGMGHFSTGTYWISNALLVDAGQFGWLVPLAVPGISAGLGVFTGLVAIGLYRWREVRGFPGVVLFAILWVCAECLRGYVLTGFPWNLAGYVWTFSLSMMQGAALAGIFGLSFLTALLGAAPAMFSTERTQVHRREGVLLLAMVLLGISAYGQYRLMMPRPEEMPDVRIRMVQANIRQKLKWDPAHMREAMRTHIAMTRSAGFDAVTHVIWPESAMPFPFGSGDPAARELTQAVPRGGLLLTGVTRLMRDDTGKVRRIYNSMRALDEFARVVMTYDKRKLVPFGEFVPFRNWLPLDKITPGTMDFSRGSGSAVFLLPKLSLVRPLICYEAIFPRLSRRTYPAWLVNITNDGWFGDSTGPYQHLQMSRMRAVEHGVPLFRAANTGISAVIDPYGRILQQLPLGTTGVLDSPLPLPLSSPTFYDRFGDILVLLLIFFGGLYSIFNRAVAS